jgi:hypothetical protein
MPHWADDSTQAEYNHAAEVNSVDIGEDDCCRRNSNFVLVRVPLGEKVVKNEASRPLQSLLWDT